MAIPVVSTMIYLFNTSDNAMLATVKIGWKMTLNVLLSIMLLLSGCAAVTTSKESKYGTSRQGIALHQLQSEKLKLGMHKREVAEQIGQPPHINPFAPDTWTYSSMTHGTIDQKKQLVLTFTKHKLTHIETIS